MTTYSTVTITGQSIYTNNQGEGVAVTVTPSSPVYYDLTNNISIAPQAISVNAAPDGTWSVPGIIDPTPTGTGLSWKLVVFDKSTGTTVYSNVVQIAFSNGASQGFLSLPPAVVNVQTTGAMPAPGNTAVAGQIAHATGNGNASMWVYESPVYLNPMNYGATGNGSTDDSNAFIAAIADYQAIKGSVIYLPALQFLLTKTISIPGGSGPNFGPIRIIGTTKMVSGNPPGGTEILWAPGASSYPLFDIGASGIQGAYLEHINFLVVADLLITLLPESSLRPLVRRSAIRTSTPMLRPYG